MRPVMRDPPLCTLADLENFDPRIGRGKYTLNQLASLHEAMDEEDEYRRRRRDVDEQERKS